MGQFISSDIYISTYTRARLVVDFTPNNSNNTNTVYAYVQMWRTNDADYTTYGTGTLYIGVDAYDWESSAITTAQVVTYNSYTQIGNTRKLTINCDAQGRWSAYFHVYTSTNNSRMTFSQHSFLVTLAPTPVYSLDISAGTGSSVTINRTYCAGSGGTGVLSAGTNKLYYGDTLKISFAPNANYAIDTHTVNGTSFVSDNTHTVSGNVSVVATANPVKASISATDANIEDNSTITVTRYNTSHTCTVTYQLGSATGTIATKSTASTISWTVPTSFYEQIPNSPTGRCTLTCETFNGDNSLGTSSCTINVAAERWRCSPDIEMSVVDINEATKALTGGGGILIRYRSNALCSISATPKNSAWISNIYISDESLPITTVDGVSTATKSYPAVSDLAFSASAVDSRGYGAADLVCPVVVPYINLTCNPSLSRLTPTGGDVVMTVSGDMYTGSLGAYNNRLVLEYRYKESGEPSYGDWIPVDTSMIAIGTDSYRSLDEIDLTSYPAVDDESGETIYPGFDYSKDYVFQIRAKDGNTVDGEEYTLSEVTKTITVKRGIPVFDWGENDFNINVPLMLKNVNILNIIYPVGTVYMHSVSVLPSTVAEVGTWESFSTGISGVYAWKRKA